MLSSLLLHALYGGSRIMNDIRAAGSATAFFRLQITTTQLQQISQFEANKRVRVEVFELEYFEDIIFFAIANHVDGC